MLVGCGCNIEYNCVVVMKQPLNRALWLRGFLNTNVKLKTLPTTLIKGDKLFFREVQKTMKILLGVSNPVQFDYRGSESYKQ